MSFFIIVPLLGLLWCIYRYSFLVPAPKGLPILMYHKVSGDKSNFRDDLTVPVSSLRRQFQYIRDKGYTPISFAELRDFNAGKSTLPRDPLIITFDDGYQSTFEFAYPLLKEFNFKATVFLPVAHIGKTNGWDGGTEALMSLDTIKKISGPLIELGLHSFAHKNYAAMTTEEIEQDLKQSIESLKSDDIPCVKALAYPYGKMPKEKQKRIAMIEIFRRYNIDFALRIGSRINPFPLSDVYELKRTGISGTDSFNEFRIKLAKGRVRLF
ncbi:MAG TPA: polysaccharide deacetylase family protein [Blastocatellia bacterium]|nr:polysaccharide deacetylase family protein [Blastocatellia bacterium]